MSFFPKPHLKSDLKVPMPVLREPKKMKHVPRAQSPAGPAYWAEERPWTNLVEPEAHANIHIQISRNLHAAIHQPLKNAFEMPIIH